MAKKRTEGPNKSQAIRDYINAHPEATASEVVPALAQQGIQVTQGLVSNVKSNMKKGTTKKVARRKAAGRRGRPSKLARGARSQAIRDYLKEHPQAGPKEVVTTLGAQGIKVTEGLVASIKYGKRAVKKKSAARKAVAGIAAAPARMVNLTAADLIEAKRLVDQLGGIQSTRQALDALEQLL